MSADGVPGLAREPPTPRPSSPEKPPKPCVAKRNETHRRQRELPGVCDQHGDHIVFLVRGDECALEPFVEKIADHEADALARAHREQKLHRLADVGRLARAAGPPPDRESPCPAAGQIRSLRLRSFRSVRENLANHAQRVFLTLPRRDVLLDAAVKQGEPDLVVVSCRGKRQQRTQLGGDLALGSFRGSKILRGRHVSHQHQCQLPLFDVALDVGSTHPRGDIPIDGPHVVAGDVGAHLVELDATALEDRNVFTGQDIRDLPAGPDLNLTNALQNLTGLHIS